MSFEDDAALLDEYIEWSHNKKAGGVDTSPSAFLVDRAKEQAFGIVQAIDEYITQGEYGDDETITVGQIRKLMK